LVIVYGSLNIGHCLWVIEYW